MTFEIVSTSPEDTSRIGSSVAKVLEGGEVIELIGDLGAGKTELVRGLVNSLDDGVTVQSPSFTISREYRVGDLTIYHYDFYRLGENPGIVGDEIAEALEDPKGVVVTEWAAQDAVHLPTDRLTIQFSLDGDNRRLAIRAGGKRSQDVIKSLREDLA